MPFVAINGTAIVNPDSTQSYFLYARQRNPVSREAQSWLDDSLGEDLHNLSKGQNIGQTIRLDKIYLITNPELKFEDYILGFLPTATLSNKNFSLTKFLGGQLTADDLVALANYHESGHPFHDDLELPKAGLLYNSASPGALKQALYNDNKLEASLDSFAALKFTSATKDPQEVLRRIEAVKIIAKLRLLQITINQSDLPLDDSYTVLMKTTDLMENAHSGSWDKVQAQFTEMYQHINPNKPLSYNEKAARADTGLLRGVGDITKLNDEQYRNLSNFIARAYAPTGNQLVALAIYGGETSADKTDQDRARRIRQKFGPLSPEGETYVAAHLKLADAAMKSGYVEAPAPAPEPAKPRPAKLGVR